MLGLILLALYGLFLFKIESILPYFYDVLSGDVRSSGPRYTYWAICIVLVLPSVSVFFFLFGNKVSDWLSMYVRHGDFYTKGVIYLFGYISLMFSVIVIFLFKLIEY